jgi:toxin ParE1/3/4
MMLRISEGAFRDLDALYDYLARDNPDAAAQTVEKILQAAERLEAHPQLGRAGRVGGTRELILPPYVLVYRIIEEVINLEAVLDGRMIPNP